MYLKSNKLYIFLNCLLSYSAVLAVLFSSLKKEETKSLVLVDKKSGRTGNTMKNSFAETFTCWAFRTIDVQYSKSLSNARIIKLARISCTLPILVSIFKNS